MKTKKVFKPLKMKNLIVLFFAILFVSCSKDEPSESKARKMNSKDLFLSFVNSEASHQLGAYNTLQYGFEAVEEQSNVLRELLKRKDSGQVLIEMLVNIDLFKMEELDSFHFFECLQIVTAQSEVINSMTDDNIRKYICFQLHCLNAIQILAETNKAYWGYPESLGSILFGLSNVMIRYEFAPFIQSPEFDHEILGLMSSGMAYDKNIVTLINNYIVEFINYRNNEGNDFCTGRYLF